MNGGSPTTLSKDERFGADRCWIYRDGFHHPHVTFTKPDRHLYPAAVEYMRVLSRQEVDELWNGEEGVDAMQLVNSLMRTVEGQRKHIASLEAKLDRIDKDLPKWLDRERHEGAVDQASLEAAHRRRDHD